MFEAYLGHNYGNSTTVAVMRAHGEEIGRIIYPSVQVAGSEQKLDRQQAASFLQNTPQAALYSPFDMRELVLDFAGSQTYHGYLAYGDKKASTSHGDYTRYWSSGTLRAALVSIGVLAPAEVMEMEVFLVTHLPVIAYNPENVRKVTECLNGDHTFSLRYGQQSRRLRVIMHVTKVVMEGAGALLVYGVPGQVRQGVIEGGGFTHDVYTTIGQKAEIDMCQSLEIGVENIGYVLNEKIAGVYDGHRFTAQEIHQILLASVAMVPADKRRYPLLYLDGQLFSDQTIGHYLQLARKELAQQIVPFVSSLWKSDAQGGVARGFGKVLYVGGAAYHFGPDLKNLIRGLMLPRDPEFADTDGVARGAEAIGPRRKAASV